MTLVPPVGASQGLVDSAKAVPESGGPPYGRRNSTESLCLNPGPVNKIARVGSSIIDRADGYRIGSELMMQKSYGGF
jgi:hypothetical protein